QRLGQVDDAQPLEGTHGGVHAVASRPRMERAITSFWICGVPSPISSPATSRIIACSGGSSEYPLWPWAMTQSRKVCRETSVAYHFTMAASLVYRWPASAKDRAR